MEILLEQLTKQFGAVSAVDNLDLSVRDGEFVAFLGPSGCGKTTTLLLIAGIYKPTAGRVMFDTREMNRVPPKKRNLGMVFQSYALYPHMSVYENLTFPLKLQGVPSKERKERAARVTDPLNISELMDRKPGQLSGGQQQRVALGRALNKAPDALLFDEPLSNLDARLRLTMRTEIKRLQNELGITSIFVTHDQVEAMTMADRVAVINEGRLEAFAPPDDIYSRPHTQFVAGFVGNPPINFLEVQLVRQNGTYHVQRPGLDVAISSERGDKAAAHEGPVLLGIRPEDVSVGEEGVQGEVVDFEPLGRENLVVVEIKEGVQIHALTSGDTRLEMGERTALSFDPDKVQFFDPVSGRSLLWG